MSQRNVEKVVGRLVLDEALRERFRADRTATVAALMREGLELTPVEAEALVALASSALDTFVSAVDPRLKQASLAAAIAVLEPKKEENRR